MYTQTISKYLVYHYKQLFISLLARLKQSVLLMKYCIAKVLRIISNK